MREENGKRLTEQEYGKLRKTWGIWKVFRILFVLFTAVWIFLALLADDAPWVLAVGGAFVAVILTGVLWYDLHWKCPKCGKRLPAGGRYGSLDLFTKRSRYTGERSLPYRCPGCGADIDLVAVVHAEEAPRC